MVSKTARPEHVSTDDAAQLAELGYESRFERRMGLWENFALGFTYLSPVVGVYSTFAIAFMAGGPPMIWSIVIAGLGQLLVALVFGIYFPGWLSLILVGGFVGGFVYLVSTMPSGPRDPGDDGARI